MDYKMFKKLFKPAPCKIIAGTDENNITSIQMEGRGLELLATSLAISEHILSKLPLGVDEYCEMLKNACEEHGTKKDESPTIDDEEIKEAISKLVDAIFS